jgi:hypothetical protein
VIKFGGQPAAKAPRKSKASPKKSKAAGSRRRAKVEAAAAGKTDGRDRTGDSRLTVEAVISTLNKMGGLKTATAEALGVSRSTLYRFLDAHPEIEEALTDIDEQIKDLAESKMLTLLRAGDAQTVRWYLETKAKDRGYTRRVENVGKDGGPIETRQKPDLSKLTDDEIDILLAAAERREQTAPTSE